MPTALRQVRMQGRYDLSAFANGGRHPLDRARAHVANGEDTSQTGFQQMAILANVGAGADEALSV
ncbi:hypothetical protein KBI52_00815, partial [Microvirga sp. HBU67558]|nr:hypothetical protein [Microvirga sp. HBU67558]